MCKSKTMLLLASVIFTTVWRLSETAASSDKGLTSALPSIQASATSPRTLNITWDIPKISDIEHWVVHVYLDKNKKALCSYSNVQAERNDVIIDGLSPNTTYYVFFGALRESSHPDYITFLKEPIVVTTPKAGDSTEDQSSFRSARQVRSGEATSSPDATTTTPNSLIAPPPPPPGNGGSKGSSNSENKGSLGRKVAEEQRKGMVRYVLICLGAGFGVICIASILTVAFYRPRTGSERAAQRNSSSTVKEQTTPTSPSGGSSEQNQSNAEAGIDSSQKRYLTTPDLLAKPRPHRPADSVVSWGSEFDILEGPEENIYNNDNPPSQGPSSSLNQQQPSLPAPRVPPKRSTGVQNMLSKFKDNMSSRWANRQSLFSGNRNSGAGLPTINVKPPENAKPPQQGNHSADGGYISGSSSTYDKPNDATYYVDNYDALNTSSTDDVYINTEFASRQDGADDDVYVNNDIAVNRH